MVVKLIQINEKEFIKDYKKIMKMCLLNGEVLPGILEAVNVPLEKMLTESEINKLDLSDEVISKRQQEFMRQEELMDNIKFTGDLDKFEDEINTMYNSELMAWIGKHMEYEKLIKK